jgi:toxin ParE1/3/4
LIAPVTFSPKSRQDLLDIVDYIAQDSRGNARRFVAKLIEQCQRIGRAPLGYASREDLAPGLRMAALGTYVIFFRVLAGTVRIERVLHGARNFPMLFGEANRSSARVAQYGIQGQAAPK